MTRWLPHPHLRRWGRFNIVGLTGFAVQLALVALLTRLCGWHYVPATALAMAIVVVQNYLAHARWTWADRPPRSARDRRLRRVRYGAAKSLSLTANVTLTAALVSRAGLTPELGTVIAVAACAIFNYAAADRIVFRSDA